MSKIGKHFIAGSWHNGHTNVENINPSDIGDVIGHYVQAHRAQVRYGARRREKRSEKMDLNRP